MGTRAAGRLHGPRRIDDLLDDCSPHRPPVLRRRGRRSSTRHERDMSLRPPDPRIPVGRAGGSHRRAAVGWVFRSPTNPVVPGESTRVWAVRPPWARPASCRRLSAPKADARRSASAWSSAALTAASGSPTRGRSTSTMARPAGSSARTGGTATPADRARAETSACRSRTPCRESAGRPTARARRRTRRQSRRASPTPRRSGSTTVISRPPATSGFKAPGRPMKRGPVA